MYEWIGAITKKERTLRLLSRICAWVPQGLLAAACRLLGWLLYAAARGEARSRVERNMEDLLGPLEDARITDISKRYLQNVALTLHEILIAAEHLEKQGDAWLEVQGEEHLAQIVRPRSFLTSTSAQEKVGSESKGCIVYTPHVGNFFFYYWYLSRRYNCLTVASAGSAELRPLYLKFQSLGCKGLDYDSTPPVEMHRALRKHLASGGIVFILGDFWRPTFPHSTWFGRTTRTPEGAAMLALASKAPIVPFYGYRIGAFRHLRVFGEPLHVHESFAPSQRAEATQVLNHFMEQVIREHPSEWFYWFNADERWEMGCQSGSDVLDVERQLG